MYLSILFRSTHAASPCSQAVDGDNHEADEGEYEGYVYGWHADKGAAVDDGSLEAGAERYRQGWT